MKEIKTDSQIQYCVFLHIQLCSMMILWRDENSILHIPLLPIKADLAHSKMRKFLKKYFRMCVCKYVHTQYFPHIFVKNAAALL